MIYYGLYTFFTNATEWGGISFATSFLIYFIEYLFVKHINTKKWEELNHSLFLFCKNVSVVNFLFDVGDHATGGKRILNAASRLLCILAILVTVLEGLDYVAYERAWGCYTTDYKPIYYFQMCPQETGDFEHSLICRQEDTSGKYISAGCSETHPSIPKLSIVWHVSTMYTIAIYMMYVADTWASLNYWKSIDSMQSSPTEKSSTKDFRA